MKTLYESPATKVLEVKMNSGLLNDSYGASIGKLSNKTYDWSDNDWSDVE